MSKFVNGEIIDKVTSPIIYTPKSLGYNIDGDGKDIKISIIDTGKPDHPAIKTIDTVNLSTSSTVYDKLGQSTIISGIIGSNDPKTLTGLVPNSKLYFAKVSDDNSVVNIESLSSAVLWSIIKQVDVIVLSPITNIDSFILHDTIKKAIDSNICVLSTAPVKDAQYPGLYPEVLTVGATDLNKELISEPGKINVIGKSLCSTYIEQEFCLASGTACSLAVAAALCAIVIQKNKDLKPQEIYSILKEIT